MNHTLWKVENFSATQILRETKFVEINIKNGHFDKSKDLENRNFYQFVQLFKAFSKITIQGLEM